MKKKHGLKRFLAQFLCICMCISMLDGNVITALASETGAAEPTAVVTEAEGSVSENEVPVPEATEEIETAPILHHF